MLLIALFCSLPLSPVKHESVAILELNRVHTADWEHRFDQLIFWDLKYNLDAHAERPVWSYHVRAWVIVKPGDYKLDRHKNRWQLTLWDRETDSVSILRTFTAISYRETATNFDVEVEERKRMPHELRQGLLK